MLALYSNYLQFPGGGPAANYPVTVLPVGSNQAARLFTDSTGSTPATNPVVTNVEGFVSFWTAPGHYEIVIAGDHIRIPLDESNKSLVWPDLWVHEQFTPATVWTINHHFGVYPHVEILISRESTESAVSHLDDETTVITFGAPTSGTAHLRR